MSQNNSPITGSAIFKRSNPISDFQQCRDAVNDLHQYYILIGNCITIFACTLLISRRILVISFVLITLLESQFLVVFGVHCSMCLVCLFSSVSSFKIISLVPPVYDAFSIPFWSFKFVSKSNNGHKYMCFLSKSC